MIDKHNEFIFAILTLLFYYLIILFDYTGQIFLGCL